MNIFFCVLSKKRIIFTLVILCIHLKRFKPAFYSMLDERDERLCYHTYIYGIFYKFSDGGLGEVYIAFVHTLPPPPPDQKN